MEGDGSSKSHEKQKVGCVTFAGQRTVMPAKQSLFVWRFLYAGVDFLIARDGTVHLLEVNDHPVGVTSALPLPGCGVGDTAHELARAVLSYDFGRDVTMVVPDFFKIESGDGTAWLLGEASGFGRPDERIDKTIREFNALAIGIRQHGGTCKIADVTALRKRPDGEVLCGQQLVQKLYRRAQRFPGCGASHFPCYNDIRLRALCADKFRCHRIISENCPQVRQPPTVIVDPSNLEFLRLVAETADENGWLIFKPRWGASSEGIERVRAAMVGQQIRRGKLESSYGSSRFICQKWLEPLQMSANHREYYVDFRLYVVAGKSISGIMRRACVPANEYGSENALAWLTTTGSVFPVGDGFSGNSFLPLFGHELLAKMKTEAEAAVWCLDQHCAKLNGTEEAIIPTLAQTLVTQKKIRQIRLAPRGR